MVQPKARQTTAVPQPASLSLESPTAFALQIAGVVVTRAQLVAALQPFLPHLTDIQPLEDGERFFFVLSNEAPSTAERVS